MQMLTGPSLTRRIVLSVILGLGMILTIFGLVSSWTVEQMAQATYRERLLLAKTIAAHVDDILRYSMGELTRTADLLTVRADGQLDQDEQEILRRVRHQLGTFATISLAGTSGAALWIEPPGVAFGASLLNHANVPAVLGTGAPRIDELAATENSEGALACLAAPVRDRAGQVSGVLMAELNPRHAALSLLPSSVVEKDARIRLIDAEGVIIVGGSPAERNARDQHHALLSALIESATAGVTVHEPAGVSSHLVAYAPVPSMPSWGVVIEQPEDVALAVPENLQRRLILAGLLAVLAAVSFGWLDARRLTRPLTELAAMAERFAAGQLDEQVRIKRRDEVGVLARAFETMRLQLKRSLGEIEAYNHELEERVQTRTREVEDRNRQLATTNAIAATVSSTLKTEEILDRAMSRVMDVTGLEHGSFRLLETTHDGEQQDGRGMIGSLLVKDICGENCLCGKAVRLRVPVVARDVRELRDATMCQEAGLRSVVAVPLCAHEQVLGVLFLGSPTERTFQQGDIDTLSAIGQQIGMALANARLYEEVEKREQARVLLIEQIITAQEGERTRIARDLHDSTGQALSAIIMGLEALEEVDVADSARLAQRRNRTRELASAALGDLRELIFDLRPIALDELGLVAALRAYANRHLGEQGVRFTFESVGMKDRLPSRLETALFRVLQEAINNVAKHARASSARIQLLRVNDDFTASVQDDGIGFDPATLGRPTDAGEGLGLLGIRERVEMLGGSVHVDSSPGAGTRIHIRLSLHELKESGQ